MYFPAYNRVKTLLSFSLWAEYLSLLHHPMINGTWDILKNSSLLKLHLSEKILKKLSACLLKNNQLMLKV